VNGFSSQSVNRHSNGAVKAENASEAAFKIKNLQIYIVPK